MWVVSVPYSVVLGVKQNKKDRVFYLNLNQYRNANHFTLNDAKKEFARIVKPKLINVPSLVQIRMSFILYPKTQQLCDVSNICCIVDKFFSDCLVTENKIPDDNYNHVKMNAYGFGGIDKTNPRVDVIIESVA